MKWFRNLRRGLGPGIVTGASDDDPSGIATYTQAGAMFGFQFLWTAIATMPLMITIQEMCARIGIVTRQGLTGLLKQYYPRWVMWLMILFSAPAIVLNISADLAGMGAVCHLLVPEIHPGVFSVVFSIALIYSLIRFNYRRIANILQFLCLVLLCYIIVPFLGNTDWGKVLQRTFIPAFQWSADSIGMLVAILGTTISPYLFFWQTAMEVEEVNEKKLFVDKLIIHDMRTDVRTGIGFSNLIFFFIILVGGTELHAKGITDVQTVEQAAQALRPFVGEGAYLLFAIGIIGTGLLAIPVLAGSISYMFSEAMGLEEGLNKKFHQAPGFYVVLTISILLALAINLAGINPVKALIYTAMLYGICSPVLIGIILHICNNKKVMGSFVNSRRSNIVGLITLVLMTAAAIALLLFTNL